MKALIPAIVLFLFIGCTEKKQPAHTPKKAASINRAQDQVFAIGPKLDSAERKIIANCDCCASDLVLRKDATFVLGSYCLEADEYCSGTYAIKGDELTLNFNSKQLEIAYLEDTIPGKVWSLKYGKSGQLKLMLGKVGSRASFKMGGDLALERTAKEAQQVIRRYKKDSIGIKLGVTL